ncbi:MAG: exonuclease domain-containing protein [Gammaproteobacteria bacterium]
MNYVFYDFETTGINQRFDQPIQISAMRVDEKFNIKEKINERCKLRDGVIPHPKALMVTRIPLDGLVNDQSFYEMMKKVRDKFSEWSPATFIGYNSIFFDEEVLRNSLFQSLYNPYLTNTNSNTRADLYKIMIALTPLKNDIVKVPTNPETNKPIYKLEALAKENNIAHEKAHDAESDVYATIGLAKQIQNNFPSFWDACMQSRGPKILMEYLKTENYFFNAPSYPSSNKYNPITLLASNPNNIKELAFFDMEYDIDKYADLRTSKIISTISGKEKIIKVHKTNKCPIILSASFMKTIDKDQKFEELQIKSEKIKSSDNFIENVKQALVDRSEEYMINQSIPEHVEDQMYLGFATRQDQNMMDAFNNGATGDEKYKISSQFSDTRLKEISQRIIYSEYPNKLSDSDKEERKRLIAEKVFSQEDKVSWCTIEKAKDEIESIKNDTNYINDKEYILEIEKFIESEEIKYKSYSS